MESILRIKITAFVELGCDLWFIPMECNALCRYNKKTKCIDYMSAIPNELLNVCILYIDIVAYENYLVLVPYMANEIAVFDVKKLQFEKWRLPIPDSTYKYRELAKFYGGVRIDHFVVLLPGEFPEIVYIDMENKTLQSKVWYPLYGEMPPVTISAGTYRGIAECVCLDIRELYFTFFAKDKGKIGRFSLDTFEIEIYTMNGVDSYFSCMKNYGNYLLLVTRTGQIFCWDKHSKKTVDVYSCGVQFDRTDKEYISSGIFKESILYNDKLYLFWRDKPQYVQVNLIDKTIKEYSFNDIRGSVSKIVLVDNSGYIFTDERGIFYQVKDGHIDRLQLYIESETLKKYFSESFFQQNIYIMENKFLNARNILPILADSRKEGVKACINAGKIIYDLGKS